MFSSFDFSFTLNFTISAIKSYGIGLAFGNLMVPFEVSYAVSFSLKA